MSEYPSCHDDHYKRDDDPGVQSASARKVAEAH
jgi:hypothetical protein